MPVPSFDNSEVAAEFLACMKIARQAAPDMRYKYAEGGLSAGLNQVVEWAKAHPEYAGPLLGSLAGGGIGAVTSLGKDKKDRNMLGSTLTGAAAGGLLGLGGGLAYKHRGSAGMATPEAPKASLGSLVQQAVDAGKIVIDETMANHGKALVYPSIEAATKATYDNLKMPGSEALAMYTNGSMHPFAFELKLRANTQGLHGNRPSKAPTFQTADRPYVPGSSGEMMATQAQWFKDLKDKQMEASRPRVPWELGAGTGFAMEGIAAKNFGGANRNFLGGIIDMGEKADAALAGSGEQAAGAQWSRHQINSAAAKSLQATGNTRLRAEVMATLAPGKSPDARAISDLMDEMRVPTAQRSSVRVQLHSTLQDMQRSAERLPGAKRYWWSRLKNPAEQPVTSAAATTTGGKQPGLFRSLLGKAAPQGGRARALGAGAGRMAAYSLLPFGANWLQNRAHDAKWRDEPPDLSAPVQPASYEFLTPPKGETLDLSSGTM